MRKKQTDDFSSTASLFCESDEYFQPFDAGHPSRVYFSQPDVFSDLKGFD